MPEQGNSEGSAFPAASAAFPAGGPSETQTPAVTSHELGAAQTPAVAATVPVTQTSAEPVQEASAHPVPTAQPLPAHPLPPSPVPSAAPLTAAPLTARQLRGAMIAGGVGFTLVQIGLGIAGGVVSIAVGVLMFGLFLGFLDRATDGAGDVGQFFGALDQIDPLLIVVIVAAALVVGAVAVVFGILSSRWILRGHGVNRPTAVTWSALGIGIVANWIVAGMVFTVSSRLAEQFSATPLAWVIGGLGTLSMVAIGVFTWWWMAHAFRARVLAVS